MICPACDGSELGGMVLAGIILVIIAIVIISFVVFLMYSGAFTIYDETTKIFETPEQTKERYDKLIEENKDAQGDLFNPPKTRRNSLIIIMNILNCLGFGLRMSGFGHFHYIVWCRVLTLIEYAR